MTTIQYLSRSPQDTMQFGVKMAAHLKGGDIVCLVGDLGSGKTTLVKGIAQGLAINAARVNSPTFVVLNIYAGRLPLYHFDLYRINELKEIANLGYEEFLYGKGVAVVEWADKLGALLPADCLKIELSLQKDNERSLAVSAKLKRWRTLINDMK